MLRIILLLLLLAVVLYFVRWYRKLSKLKQKLFIKYFAIISLAGLLVALVLTGRLNWLIAVAGALLSLLPRMARLFIGLWPSIRPYFQRYQQNKHSSMQTQFIHLQINMLTGEWQGEVLKGDYVGQKLQIMSLEQLLQLLEQCKEYDAESAALLTAYLDHQHVGWRKSGEESYEYPASDSLMNEKQARNILGIAESADKSEVIKAHKSLMQKLHPDRGGSDYLAQQINKARDTLLKDI